mmetsp:Transcript_46355/g.115952  ORF Transcript_46355/g.115952 Transcript_46355/m.115952 type:complete len:413 (+) Transcript_46355:361-1599(+)
MPNGVAVTPDIGYEKPQSGPTTNFVGNHMTQGAIDLVQAQLGKEDDAHLLLRDQEYDRLFGKPKLLPTSQKPSATGDPAPGNALVVADQRVWANVQTYQWADDGSHITITVPPPVPASAAPTIRLSVESRAVLVEISWALKAHASDWVFRLRRTYGELRSDGCLAVHDGPRHGVRIRLLKADASVAWPQLEAPLEPSATTLAPAGAGVNESERLARLRRAVRQQRAKKQPLDGKLFDPEVLQDAADVGHAGPQAGQPPLPPHGAGSPSQACVKAAELAKQGDYAAAAALYGWAVGELPAEEKVERATALAELSACQVELGALRAAVDSLGAALQADSGGRRAVELLLRRASLREQLEAFGGALEDYRRASALMPGCLVAGQGAARAQASLRLCRCSCCCSCIAICVSPAKPV